MAVVKQELKSIWDRLSQLELREIATSEASSAYSFAHASLASLSHNQYLERHNLLLDQIFGSEKCLNSQNFLNSQPEKTQKPN